MKVRVVSPWYPDYASPHSGIFVAQQVTALKQAGYDISVEVPQIFPAPPGIIPAGVTSAMRSLAAQSIGAMFPTNGQTTYIPTPVPTRGGPLGRARAMACSMGILREFRDDSADLVHAHLGLPTAWATSETSPQLPLVVTEHWSNLEAVLADPAAAAAYTDVLRKADAFITVSGHLREQIVNALGDWALERIVTVPNIVDLREIPFRDRGRFEFGSWIYVGGLMEHKGVQTLLRVFSDYTSRHDPTARLTLVGEGPLRPWIEMFSASRGLADSVSLAGPVAHSNLGGLLDEADVMVHLSPFETFGIASLEGIGAGMPVISLDNPGAREAWGDIQHLCGVMLKVDSQPHEIADTVAALREAPQRMRLAQARRVLEERYAPDVIARRLSEVYEAVLT